MTDIAIRPMRDDLPFGGIVSGVTHAALQDEGVRREIEAAFVRDGMLVFEGVESTPAMQVEISNIFGPLKDHPVKIVERLNNDTMPGVITIRADPNASIVEIDGEPLLSWQPWHFDHSYNDELNRAGVLRAETIAPEGGLTGFIDGIQIYNAMSPELRAQAEDVEVIYTLDQHYERQWFGLPPTFREIQPKGKAILEIAKTLPRAVHPAVWTRETGEKVVHLSPYGARGIVGRENAEGNELLRAIWDELERVKQPYYHQWKPTDMVVWDNWRMLHEAGGCNPKYERVMYRTTIKGDYGLGRWESSEPQGDRWSVPVTA